MGRFGFYFRLQGASVQVRNLVITIEYRYEKYNEAIKIKSPESRIQPPDRYQD
jgi:hypothetical protein